MTDATLERDTPATDPLAAIEQESREAKAELYAYACKIADGKAVDHVTLRDLMHKAGVGREYIDAIVKERRTRQAGFQEIEHARQHNQRAAELRRAIAQKGQEHDALKAELERRRCEELEPLAAQQRELEAELERVKYESLKLDASGHSKLRNTAPAWIDRKIEALNREYDRLHDETRDYTDIANRVLALEKRAAFWRGWMQKLEAVPMARPQMPQNVAYGDRAIWNWFFGLAPHIGKPIREARANLVSHLERQALDERESLKQFTPLFRRQSAIKDEIERLEAEKLTHE